MFEPWELQIIRYALHAAIKADTKKLEAAQERALNARGNRRPGAIADRTRTIGRMRATLAKIEGQS